MSATPVELSRVIRVHYGSALKEADREQSGPHEVFGSSGLVGHHSRALFDYPSIVIGRKGSVGSVTYAARGGWAIDTAFYVERIAPKECELRYLYHALATANLAQHTITTSIPGLSRDDIYRTRIRLPAPPEQRRIADILDKADAIRHKRKQVITLTEELLRAAFLEVFGDPVTNPKGWKTVPLDQLVNQERGISYGVVQRGPEVADGVPIVRISNFANNRFDGTTVVRTSTDISNAYRRTILRGGELVVSIRGTVGRIAIVPASVCGWNVSREVAVIPLLDGVNRTLVHHALLSDGVQRFILGNVKGVAQSGINLADLRQSPIPMPTPTQISRFDRFVEVVRAAEQRLTSGSRHSELLFDSLVARAFSAGGTS